MTLANLLLELPAWALALLAALAAAAPFVARALRPSHPAIAAGIDEAQSLALLLEEAIAKGDHTGSVAALVKDLAESQDLAEHPAVRRIVS